MPLTDEDLKALQEKLLKPLEDKFAETQKKLADFETQFPSMSKKHAGEATAEARKLFEELAGKITAPGRKEDKPDAVTELQKKIDALIVENTKAKEAQETESRKAEIAKALAKHKIVVGLEDYAHSDLMKLVDRDEAKGLVIKFKDKIGGTEIDTALSVEEGVKRFLKEKAVFVQSDLKGGAGSGSGNSFPDGVKPTWAQLKANATLLREWQEKDPQYVSAAQTESLAKLTARQG